MFLQNALCALFLLIEQEMKCQIKPHKQARCPRRGKGALFWRFPASLLRGEEEKTSEAETEAARKRRKVHLLLAVDPSSHPHGCPNGSNVSQVLGCQTPHCVSVSCAKDESSSFQPLYSFGGKEEPLHTATLRVVFVYFDQEEQVCSSPHRAKEVAHAPSVEPTCSVA